MKKFTVLMLTIASFVFVGDASAQIIISQGPSPTLETTPTEFGDAGTKVKIKVSNGAPVTLGSSQYALDAIGTDDKRAPFSCISTPTDGNVCECVYTVTQADTNRGFINFGATENGEEVEEDFLTGQTSVTEYKKTVVKTIDYNSAETGWAGSGLNDCSMNGWSWPTGNGGFVETDPLLPSIVEVIPPGFVFDIANGEVPDGAFWIDPPVAVGYNYNITGAEFVSVKMPSFQTVADPDTYTLTYGTQTITLQPGDDHSFQNPVSTFKITDINPPTPLDANDVTAFPIGIDLTDAVSDVQIRQVAIPDGPSVAPTLSKSKIYPPASVSLSANAVDATGGTLQFNWTGPNLSNSNLENPSANFISPVATPTTQTYAVTAIDGSGASSSTETVDLTLLPKQCIGFQGHEIFDLLPVYTTSLNGNYTIKARIPALTSHLSARLAEFKSVDPDINSISYSSDITNQNNLLASGIDKVSSVYDGLNLGLYSPGTPGLTEFWSGSALIVGQWYSLNIGMNTNPTDATDVSCRTNNVKFRLPQAQSQSGRRRFLSQRPMEIQAASGGSITTVMVPIHPKTAKTILTDRLDVSTVVGGGNVVSEDIIVNRGGRPSGRTENSGVGVIKGRGLTVIKNPTPVKEPVKRDETDLKTQDVKKEDIKPKRLPWGR